MFESSESQSTRPDITDIIEQLQEEVRTWSPTSILLSQTTPTEPKESRGSSVSSELGHELLTGSP